jgi:hypothetical protein
MMEEAMKTLEQVFAEHERRKRFGTRYAQSADQLALGGRLINQTTPNSIEFGPSANRYECDKVGQYLLDLPA